jgi:hypothetical protein
VAVHQTGCTGLARRSGHRGLLDLFGLLGLLGSG